MKMSSSSSNPNIWSPYKDCSQGVCSIYCPRWCYMMFPPPPPSDVTDLSPLVIAVIGILASACILVSYYALVSRYCKRRPDELHSLPQPHPAGGLDEAVIKTIAVCKYKKSGQGLADCPVCLTEFEEGDTLRLLPECRHAFHLPCIDPWLKNQPTCPLCRSDIIASSSDQLLIPVVQTVVEIADLGLEHSGNRGLMRRSVSLDSVPPVRISDILEASDDDDEDVRVENLECGSSREKSAIKRSTSTGRFTFSRSGKGRSSSSIHP